MKGIVLAGGNATRLYPVTISVSKQLLPVYDKPMIFYPLSTLMLAGVREMLIITKPNDADLFKRVLGDGSQWGVSLSYAEQAEPKGIAQAFLIGERFLDGDAAALVLGDNIFFGGQLRDQLSLAGQQMSGATVFCNRVADAHRYGVISFGEDGAPRSIIEKPTSPTSPWAVTGLYFYDNQVIDIARGLTPSARGELEITDVNNAYLAAGTLQAVQLGRGSAWFDAGTHDALLEASQFVHTIEKRQGVKIGCLEEIACRMGYIDAERLAALAAAHGDDDLGDYLTALLNEPARR